MSNLDPLNMFLSMLYGKMPWQQSCGCSSTASPWWRMMPQANEMPQLFKLFMEQPKLQQSQYLMEQFIKECMACISDNTAISIKLFQTLPHLKTPEDFRKLQEEILTETIKKNISHVQVLLQTYTNLMEESYHCAKQHAADLSSNAKDLNNEFVKFRENVCKATENAANMFYEHANKCSVNNKSGASNNKNCNNNAGKKK